MLRVLARPLLTRIVPFRYMTKIETQLNHYITDQLEHEPVRSLPLIKGGWGDVQARVFKSSTSSDVKSLINIE